MFAPIPAWLSMPFCYGFLVSYRLWVPVDPVLVRKRVPGFRAHEVDGFSWLSLDFQAYAANSGTLVARTGEVELCLLGQPESAPRLDVSLLDYLRGEDQTRTLGLYRLQVPCDNTFAIAAGIALFGEHKYPATLTFSLPSPNCPAVADLEWSVADAAGHLVVSVAVRDASAPGEPLLVGTLTRYAHLDGVLHGSRWDLFGDHALVPLSPGRAVVTPGEGDLPFLADLQLLTRAPMWLQRFTSRPAAIEGRAYRA